MLYKAQAISITKSYAKIVLIFIFFRRETESITYLWTALQEAFCEHSVLFTSEWISVVLKYINFPIQGQYLLAVFALWQCSEQAQTCTYISLPIFRPTSSMEYNTISKTHVYCEDDNIKVDIKDMRSKIMKCILLTRGKVQCLFLVNTAKRLLVPSNVWHQLLNSVLHIVYWRAR
jgi:hypothetical protein